MALEYKDWKVDLLNRLWVFENGNPVNPEKWERFKGITVHLFEMWLSHGSRQWAEITEHLIHEVFNQIKDPFTGFTYRTSNQLFEIFCNNHAIEFKQVEDRRAYIIRIDPIAYSKVNVPTQE